MFPLVGSPFLSFFPFLAAPFPAPFRHGSPRTSKSISGLPAPAPSALPAGSPWPVPPAPPAAVRTPPSEPRKHLIARTAICRRWVGERWVIEQKIKNKGGGAEGGKTRMVRLGSRGIGMERMDGFWAATRTLHFRIQTSGRYVYGDTVNIGTDEVGRPTEQNSNKRSVPPHSTATSTGVLL